MNKITFKKLIELGFYYTIVSAEECGSTPFVYLCFDIAPGISLISDAVDLPYDYSQDEYNDTINKKIFEIEFFNTEKLKFDKLDDLSQLVFLLTKNVKK